VPFLLAFALRSAGWYWRACNIWHKASVLPESVKDRPTNTHEYILIFAKSPHYYYDYEALLEPAAYDGRKATVRTPSPKYGSESTQSIHTKGGQRWNFAEIEVQAADKFFGKKTPVGTFRGDIGREWVRLPVRNKRSVWVVNTAPLHEAHFAAYPPKLVEPMIKAACPKGGIVLDPFMGAGTTALVARKLNRNFTGIELNPQYVEIAKKRLQKELGLFV
jgi:DNA modification methylase